MDKQLRPLERLLEKLSALRQELTDDERVWLDRLLIQEPEAHAHILKARHDSTFCPTLKLNSTSATYQISTARTESSSKKNTARPTP